MLNAVRSSFEHLPSFQNHGQRRLSDAEIGMALRSSKVRIIKCLPLGPAGTNIDQANTHWLRMFGLTEKSVVRYAETPEAAIAEALRPSPDDEISLFWTCAVFYNEAEVFFTNVDINLFLSSIVIPLDNMMLCGRGAGAESRDLNAVRIAVHPSPLHLLRNTGCELVLTKSNGHAADLCAEGLADMCVTTETCARARNLVVHHVFGCPDMVFFVGISAADERKLREIVANGMPERMNISSQLRPDDECRLADPLC